MSSSTKFIVSLIALALASKPLGAAPAPETNEAASNIPVSSARSPTDVNIRIPEAFNMKLLAGPRRHGPEHRHPGYSEPSAGPFTR
ncbi:hypothetical protein MRX96_052206 [Rhipicephalus microplus]